ncbi:hypothetical protein HanPI659440_Chr13g0506951 [Helianthus annuus]|nr:hypothetical protein HanPI659440_Chr13g0506951 [Helianthus annuus]
MSRLILPNFSYPQNLSFFSPKSSFSPLVPAASHHLSHFAIHNPNCVPSFTSYFHQLRPTLLFH